MVLADSVNRPVVNKKLQKDLKVELIYSFFIVLYVFAISDFVLHVFDFLLSGVESHAPHHVGNRTQRHLSIQLSCFGCVLVF